MYTGTTEAMFAEDNSWKTIVGVCTISITPSSPTSSAHRINNIALRASFAPPISKQSEMGDPKPKGKPKTTANGTIKSNICKPDQAGLQNNRIRKQNTNDGQ
jgi:hypothetical protein